MRYHDYHLSSYEVSDRGETITLHLVYGYPDQEADQSCIRFSDVALYNFVHNDNAIIVDIDEVAIPELIEDIGSDIVEWDRMYRVKLMSDSLEGYSLKLQTENYKAWRIESAIGFYGFVIAKAVLIFREQRLLRRSCHFKRCEAVIAQGMDRGTECGHSGRCTR